MGERCYYVYILACETRRLYIGVTNSIWRRVREHKTKAVEGFTSRYQINRLVYFETFHTIHYAIAYEKKLKGRRRDKKIALIEAQNPQWKDLAQDWYDDEALSPRDPSALRASG